jgi:hypothetical protein
LGSRDEFAQDCLLQQRVRCEPDFRLSSRQGPIRSFDFQPGWYPKAIPPVYSINPAPTKPALGQLDDAESSVPVHSVVRKLAAIRCECRLWPRRRQELKDCTPWLVRLRPQSSTMRFDDRAADR